MNLSEDCYVPSGAIGNKKEKVFSFRKSIIWKVSGTRLISM
jgi:hypothetical protein